MGRALSVLEKTPFPRERLDRSIEEFVSDQNSPATQRVYEAEIRKFFRDTQKEALEEVTVSDLLQYKERNLGLKGTTLQRKLITLKQFFGHCVARGLLERNPVEGIKLPRPQEPIPKSLEFAQARSLLEAIDTGSALGRRDSAMIHLMLRAGLRASEVVRIDLKDFAVREGYIRLRVHGKGAKERDVDLGRDLYQRVLDYLPEREEVATGALFLSTRRGRARRPWRISLRSLQQRVTCYAKRAGIEASAHALRHTFAFTAEKNGCPLEDLRKALGHTSLAVTQRYILRNPDRKNPACDFVPPFHW